MRFNGTWPNDDATIMYMVIVLWLQVGLAVLVLLLAMVRGMRFVPGELSDFELKRRAAEGDRQALGERQFRTLLPMLMALQRVVAVVLTVSIVALSASYYHWLFAVLLSLVWLLVAEMISTTRWLGRLTRQLTARYEHQLMRLAHRLRPFLHFFAAGAVAHHAQAAFYSKDELLRAIEKSGRALNEDEKLLVRQALHFGSTRVKDIMTPRSKVVTLHADDTVGPLLLDRLHKAGHFSYPVIRHDLNHVVGVLRLNDLMPPDPKLKKVGDAMSGQVYYVHQDKSLDHVLHAFQQTKLHLFMVANDFEEVVGVVSIEDVLQYMLGRKVTGDFDRYEDLRAVSQLGKE